MLNKAKKFVVVGTVASLCACGNSGSNKGVEYDTSNYTLSTFSELMVEENNHNLISIKGYVPTYLSDDKTSSYLWNTRYDGVPQADMDMGDVVSIGLRFDKDSDYGLEEDVDFSGDTYYTVYGNLVIDDYVDMYGFKHSKYIDVDKLEVIDDDELPENIIMYDSFVDSYEWEALSDIVSYIGGTYSEWYDNEELIEPTTPYTEYDIDSTISGIEENYPTIYSDIDTALPVLVKLDDAINKYKEKEERPESSDEYEEMYSCYNEIAECISVFGYFE